MRRIATFIVMSFLALTTSLLMANDKHGIDFDKGTDATGIIEHAKEQGRMRHARPLHQVLDEGELPRELARLGVARVVPSLPQETSNSQGIDKRPLPLPNKVACDEYPISEDDSGGSIPSLCGKGVSLDGAVVLTGKPAVTPVTGPYQPIVRDDPDYKRALYLKGQLEGGAGFHNHVNIISMGVPGSGPVLAQFPAIAARYDQYWKTSVALDRDDESLSVFADRLNAWYGKIQARRKLFASHKQTYKQLCEGRQLPRDEQIQCDAYANRFNDCVDVHNASLSKLQGLIQVWKDQRACLQSKGDSFKSSFLDWVKNTVRSWIGQATKVLEDGLDCKIGKTTLANNNGRWALHCSYTCKSHTGPCGIAGVFDHEPTAGEIELVCPDFANRPPVMCPAPF